MRRLKFDSQYRSDKPVNFPMDNISEDKKKDVEYYRQCAVTILTKYVNNKCWVPYDDVLNTRSITELRKYASGSNSPEKYKDTIISKIDPKTGRRRKNTLNISWDIMRILSQKLDVVTGYFLKMKFDTETSAIDYQSSASKRSILATLKLNANDRMKMMREELNEVMGTPVAGPLPMPGESVDASPIEFRSEKEVELFASMGGVFLQQEAAIVNLLDKTDYESGYSTIYKQHIHDAVTLGLILCRVEVDANGNIVKKTYVDPEYAIIPNSKHDDFNDMTWAGEIRQMSIAQIRAESKLDDDSLINIAQKYSSGDGLYQSGGFYLDAQKFKRNEGFNDNMIDQVMVDVVDVRWIGTVEESYAEMKRPKSNNFIINQVSDQYTVRKRHANKGKVKKTYSRQVIYKCKMVVGSNEIFDYGIDEFMSYDKDSSSRMKVVFPYKAQRTGSDSIVERCATFVDEANLSLMKLRVAKKKMPSPPNLVIKKSSLENVSIDGREMNPTDLMGILQDEGFLVVDDQNPWGNNVSQGRAIDTIPTDVIKQLLEWRLDIDFNIKMIESVTGINDIFAAQTPSSETGLGVSRIAIEATSNALFPITYTLMGMYSSVKRCEISKWQVIARHISDKDRERLSINRALQYIKISSHLDEYDFGIKIEVSPNEDDKLMLLQDINRMRDMRRQVGVGGITPSDYFLIRNMVKNGNIKQAQFVLAQIEEMRAEEDRRAEDKRVQDNMQSQMMSNQQSSENQAQLLQGEKDMELRNQIEIEKTKAMLKMEENRRKALDERKSAASETLWGWSNSSYSRRNR